MTVCIGALCAAADGRPQSLVIASDRMVTMGGIIEFEHDIPKGTRISEKAIALMAGDALRGARLARTVRSQVPAVGGTAENLANAAAHCYMQLRQEQVQNELFAPRSLTIAQFYQGLQHQMLPQIAGNLDERLAQYNYGVECLIGGVDDEAAHLYLVMNPGGAFTDFEPIGFAAIGSGAIHAVQSLIGDEHTGKRDLQGTVYSAYVAKKRAEVAPGVGKDTDMWIIDGEGIFSLPDDTLNELESIYGAFRKPVRDDLKNRISKLRLVDGKKEKGKEDTSESVG